MRPTSVLIVTRNFKRRGVETRVLDVMGCIDRDRFKMDVCALRGTRDDMDSLVEELGGTVHRMQSASWGDTRAVKKLLGEKYYDVVHFQDHYGHGPSLRIAAEMGVENRVIQFHSTNFPDTPTLTDRIRKRIRHSPRRLRTIDTSATHILACSRRVMKSRWREDWERDHRCLVLYNGVDLGPFRQSADRRGVRDEFNLSEDSPLCIHIGRPSRVKNYPGCFDVFRAICRRAEREGIAVPRLLLVGVDPQTEKGRDLQKLSAKRGIGERVLFAGVRTDVPRLLKASDLMLLTSFFEGHPGTVIEACCAGTPVLTSILSGVEEIRTQLPEARISSVSLDAPIGDWAEAALQQLALAVTEADRRVALESMGKSVFSIETHTRKLCEIWSGPSDHPGGSVP